MPSKVLSILVVDDEALLREYVCMILKEAGYAVAEAGNPDEALMLLAVRSFSIVISDIQMPEGDGLTLLKTIRRKFPDLRLVVMSGRKLPRPGEIPEGVQFLSKPFSDERLLAVVRGV